METECNSSNRWQSIGSIPKTLKIVQLISPAEELSMMNLSREENNGHVSYSTSPSIAELKGLYEQDAGDHRQQQRETSES